MREPLSKPAGEPYVEPLLVLDNKTSSLSTFSLLLQVQGLRVVTRNVLSLRVSHAPFLRSAQNSSAMTTCGRVVFRLRTTISRHCILQQTQLWSFLFVVRKSPPPTLSPFTLDALDVPCKMRSSIRNANALMLRSIHKDDTSDHV